MLYLLIFTAFPFCEVLVIAGAWIFWMASSFWVEKSSALFSGFRILLCLCVWQREEVLDGWTRRILWSCKNSTVCRIAKGSIFFKHSCWIFLHHSYSRKSPTICPFVWTTQRLIQKKNDVRKKESFLPILTSVAISWILVLPNHHVLTFTVL